MGEAFYVKADVTLREQVENLVKDTFGRYGQVDVPFGNLGVPIAGTAPDTSIES
jgi:NAD(P)-dependent dehydrogenase (short-subunit alcohol dehydrogenase family)